MMPPGLLNLKPVVVLSAVVVCALLVTPERAEASRVNDWHCLTADMTGNDANRESYIRASDEAARVFRIAPAILVAIKRVESGLGLNPMVTGHNKNGSTDRGFYQVNADFWLPVIQRTGASMAINDLHGIRQNALVAAWVLRRQMNRSDVPNTLEAVGYYHKGGGTDARARNIRQIYKDKFLAELRKMMSRCA